MIDRLNYGSAPLRFRCPVAFDALLTALRAVGLNASDVIAEMVGTTNAGEVLVRIRFGRDFHAFLERPFPEADLLAPTAAVADFFSEAVDHVHRHIFADYRTDMGQARP